MQQITSPRQSHRKGAVWDDGTPIQLWTCNGGSNQKWGAPVGFSAGTPSTGAALPATFGKTWEQIGYVGNPFANFPCQCTWGMMVKTHQYTQDWNLNNDWGVYPYVYGNAYQWTQEAIAAGWTVITDGMKPQVNSIVVLPPNVDGAGGLGHVAWVKSINGNGTITISSTNWAGSNCNFVDAVIFIVPSLSYILIPPPPNIGNSDSGQLTP